MSSDGSKELMALSAYLAFTGTLVSVAFIAVHKIVKYPERYHYCFYSERARRHAIAGGWIKIKYFLWTMQISYITGFLLTLLFCLPVFTRFLGRSWIIFIGLIYTFVVVPLAAGFFDMKPLLKFAKSSSMYPNALRTT